MKRLAIALLIVSLVLVGCDDAAEPPLTTLPPGTPTTSTTIAGDSCARLVDDTAAHLELVIDVLDATPLEDFRDRDTWPEALFAVEQQGEDLDRRAEALGCEPAVIRQQAIDRARVDPESGLAEYLLQLLGSTG